MATPSKSLADKLRRLVRGEVIVEEKALQRFSRDQSIYEILPAAVVLPKDLEDVRRLVLFASEEGLPITPRGGGSGTAGSALGSGLVMAFPDTAFWGEISGFSVASGSAQVSVRSGVLHNDLQNFLKQKGFFLPADVTSAAISRIGGNIATRASGPHSLKYGPVDRFLEQLEFVTAGGVLISTADASTIPERFKTSLTALKNRIRSDDEARGTLIGRQGLKTASGYNLSAFLEDVTPGQLIMKLLSGSVGTIGLVTRATLRGEIYEQERSAVLLFFDDLTEAVNVVMDLRTAGAAAIELISRETLRIIRDHVPSGSNIDQDAHLLLVEVTGQDSLGRIRAIADRLRPPAYRMKTQPQIAANDDEIEKLWHLRKQILWLIEHPKPELKALAVVNDVGVPISELANFVSEVEKIFARHHVIALIYGHAGEGNLHLRPLFDLSQPDLQSRIRRLADDVYDVVLRHGGTVTSEHGMGRLRAPYLKREWGEALYQYMREVKAIFDPDGILNPGVMFTDAPITDHMRTDLLQP